MSRIINVGEVIGLPQRGISLYTPNLTSDGRVILTYVMSGETFEATWNEGNEEWYASETKENFEEEDQRDLDGLVQRCTHLDIFFSRWGRRTTALYQWGSKNLMFGLIGLLTIVAILVIGLHFTSILVKNSLPVDQNVYDRLDECEQERDRLRRENGIVFDLIEEATSAPYTRIAYTEI